MDNVGLFFLIFTMNGQFPTLDAFMIFGAEYLIYLSIALMFILVFKGEMKEKKSILLAALAFPIGVLLIKLIHIFFIEPRPFINFNFAPLVDSNADASFPSRHTSIMSVIAFSYTYFKSKWSTLFLAIMIWVGISRIYVGVHYPLDIFGGITVGIISLFIAIKLLKVLKIYLNP